MNWKIIFNKIWGIESKKPVIQGSVLFGLESRKIAVIKDFSFGLSDELLLS